MIINTRKERSIRASKARRRISPDQELESYLAFRYPDVALGGKLGGLRKKRQKKDGRVPGQRAD